MSSLLFKLFLSAFLGALIGLKNQISQIRNAKQLILGGFRSYSLLGMLGFVSGQFYTNGATSWSLLLSGVIFLMILIYYAEGVFIVRAVGITDEVSAMFAHLTGFLIVTEILELKYVVAMIITIVFILNRKKQIKKISKKITDQEVIEFSLFAILAFVIVPFLPQQTYTLSNLGLKEVGVFLHNQGVTKILNIEFVNPFRIGIIVILITAIDLLGYILNRFLSSTRSLFISATIGGFISSTSTTISLAITSVKNKVIHDQNKILPYVSAAIIANGISFLETLLIIAPISLLLAGRLFATLLMLFITSLVIAYYLYRYERGKYSEDIIFPKSKKSNHIISLGPIFKFAFLLASIQFLSRVALLFLGDTGFVITSLIAGLTGIDAVSVSLAELVSTQSITLNMAFWTFMGVNLVNLISKTFYISSIGNVLFAKKFGLYMFIIYIGSLVVGVFT